MDTQNQTPDAPISKETKTQKWGPLVGGGVGLLIGGWVGISDGLSPTGLEMVAGASCIIGAGTWALSDIVHAKIEEVCTYERCNRFLSTNSIAQGVIQSVKNLC